MPLHSLQVMALNAVVASEAKRPVTLVVMLGTVRAIVENIEVGGLEGRMAVEANKAAAVISSCKAAI